MKKHTESLILFLVLLMALNPLPMWAASGLVEHASPYLEKAGDVASSQISIAQRRIGGYREKLTAKFLAPAKSAVVPAAVPASAPPPMFSGAACAERISNHSQLNNFSQGYLDGDGNPVNEYTETTQGVSGLSGNTSGGYWTLSFNVNIASCCSGGLTGWIWVNNVLYMTTSVSGDGSNWNTSTSNGATVVATGMGTSGGGGGGAGIFYLRIPYTGDSVTVKTGIDAHPHPQLDWFNFYAGCETLHSSISTPSPSLVAGTNSTYDVTLSNTGRDWATSASVKVQIPAGMNLISASGSGWSCSPTSGSSPVSEMNCSYSGTIAPAGSSNSLGVVVKPVTVGSLTMRASVNASAGGTPVTASICTGTDSPSAGCSAQTSSVGSNPVLNITQTPPATLQTGVNNNWILTVTNTGTATATIATAKATLPTGLDLISATGSGWTCLPASGLSPVGTITCNYSGSIGTGGGSSAITMVVRPKGIGGTNVTNYASVGTYGGSDAPTPNTCTAANSPSGGCGAPATKVVTGPKLNVSKSTPTLSAGTNSTYIITVTNNGNQAATAARVSEVLPTGLDLISATGTGWTCSPSSGSSPVGTITCNYSGSIAASGGTSTIGITVRPLVGAIGSSVTNYYSVDADELTSPPVATTCTAANSPSVGCGAPVGPITIIGGPTLSVSKSSPTLNEGINSTYTITVTNSGVGAATTAQVKDALPTGLDLISATGTGWICTPSSGSSPVGTITCNYSGSIAASGGTSTISVVANPITGSTGSSVSNKVSVDTSGGAAAPSPATCTGIDTPSVGCGAVVGPTVIAPGLPDNTKISASPNPTNGPAAVTGLVVAVASSVTVTIRNADNSVLCTTTSAANGSFSCAGTTNGGPLSVVASNAGGNSPAASVPLTIDNVAPSAPTGTASPNPTSGAATVSGNAEAGSTVVVRNADSSVLCTTTATVGGTYSCSGTATGGPLSATATDAAGNVSSATSIPLTVDNTSPATPTGTASPNPTNGPVTISGGAGSAEAGAVVTVRNPDSSVVCTTTAAGDGSYSCSGTANGGPLSITATDAVGNTSPAGSLPLTFDNTAPSAPTGTASPNPTNGPVTVSGNAEANSTVIIRNPDNSVVCTTTAAGDGSFSCSGTVTGGPLSATSTDTAGNVSPSGSLLLTFDNNAPFVPTGTASPNPTNGPVTITGGAGSAEAGAVVTVRNPDNSVVCTTTAAANGSYSCSGTANGGPLSIMATDAAGNVSPTGSVPLTFDNSAPSVPTGTAAPNPTNGPVTITGGAGAAEANSTVIIRNPDNSVVCTTTAAVNGSYSCSGTATGGPLSATATDAAGNVSAAGSIALTFDNTAPSAPTGTASPNPTNGPVTVTGNAEANSTVTVRNPDSSVVCTTTATLGGAYSCASTATGGPLSVTATDAAGNVSPATSLPLTFDNSAPSAPDDSKIAVNPNPTNGLVTITGNAGAAEAGSTVTVRNPDNSVVCTAIAAGDGSFSCAGTATGGPLSATATDAVGNTSSVTSIPLTIDTTAPSAPTGTASPNPANGPVTVSGNAEAGSTVTIRNPDSSVVCTTTATAGGAYSCSGTANGGPLSATATDSVGNTSASGSIPLTFDNVAPSAPTGSASPTPTSGAVTVAGNAEANSTVTVKNSDGTTICTTTATVGGTYSCSGTAINAPLSVTATDTAGNVSSAASVPLVIDTAAPAIPTGTASPSPTNGPVSVTGTAEAGTTVTVRNPDSSVVCTTTATAGGTYSCAGTATGGPLNATATDAAGNVSPVTSVPLTFDNSSPSAPVVTSVSPNPTSGPVTIVGTAEANSTVTVRNPNSSVICTTTAAGDGSFSCSGTATGEPIFTTATDAAGNTSPATSTPLTVDTSAPSTPDNSKITAAPNPTNGLVTITGIAGAAEVGSIVIIRNPDNSVICTTTVAGDGSFSCSGTANGGPLSVTATDAAGNISPAASLPLTFDNSAPATPSGTASPNPTSGPVTISGTAEAASTVIVRNPDSSVVCTTTTAGDGSFSCSGIANSGPLLVTAIDAAGNTSPVTSTPLTVDNGAPTAPDSSKISVNPNPTNGPVAIIGTAGAAEAGSTVIVRNPDNSVVCTTTAAGDGPFTCSGTATGGPLSATATDGAGNISPSTSLPLTFDNVAPTAPTGTANPNPTSGAVTVTGTAEANSTVTVRNPDSSVICTATATVGGTFSCTGTATGGPVNITATDAAGNISLATSVPLTVDTGAPAAPDSSKISTSPNPTNGPVTVTGVAGAAEAGATVIVRNPDNSVVCTTIAAADGSFICSGTATGGPLSATATDAAGNTSPATSLPVTFDNTAPSVPNIGIIAVNPNPTNGPVIITGAVGSAEPGASVTIKNPDGTTICTVTVAGDGSFTCSGTVTGGPLTITATDAAGNVSPSTSLPLTFDNSAPATPTGVTASPNPTSGPVTISGSAEPGSRVTVKNPDGTTICTTIAAGDASFSCSGTATGGPLAVTATDAAGNVSPIVSTPLTVDTLAPTAPDGTKVTVNPNPTNGPVTVTGVTGAAEPGSTVTIKNPDNSVVCTTVVALDGSFSCAGTATAGPLTVTATDPVGNTSPATSLPVTVDTTAPSIPNVAIISINPNPTNGPVTVTGNPGAVEPGSTVTVKNPDITVVCTAVAAPDGSFSCVGTVTGGPATVTVTDPAGNTSPPANVPVTLNTSTELTMNLQVSPTGAVRPKQILTFTLDFKNETAFGMENVKMVVPIPSVTDFKLNSIVTDPGMTGLTLSTEYSSDNGATWTYTPVNNGGGAAFGYDRNVRIVRVTAIPTQVLSQTIPNHQGSISLQVRVR